MPSRETSPRDEVLEVGQRVVVMGKRKGVVRFFGPTAYGPGDSPRPQACARRQVACAKGRCS